MPGISNDINVKVKTSGLDELKNELKSFIELASKENIEIPIDINTIQTEAQLHEAIAKCDEITKNSSLLVPVDLIDFDDDYTIKMEKVNDEFKKAEKERERVLVEEQKIRSRIAKEQAEEVNRIAREQAAEAERITREQAAEAERIAKEKAIEAERIAKEQEIAEQTFIRQKQEMLDELNKRMEYKPNIELSGEFSQFTQKLLEAQVELLNIKNLLESTSNIDAFANIKTDVQDLINNFDTVKSVYNEAINSFSELSRGFISAQREAKTAVMELGNEFSEIMSLSPELQKEYDRLREGIYTSKTKSELSNYMNDLNKFRDELEGIIDIEDEEQKAYNRAYNNWKSKQKEKVNDINEEANAQKEVNEEIIKQSDVTKGLNKDIRVLASNLKALYDKKGTEEFAAEQEKVAKQFEELYNNVQKFQQAYNTEDAQKDVQLMMNKLGEMQKAFKQLENKGVDNESLEQLAKLSNLLNLKVPGTAKGLSGLFRIFKSFNVEGKGLTKVFQDLGIELSSATVAIAGITAGILAIIAIIGTLMNQLNKLRQDIVNLVKGGFELLTASIKKIPAVMNSIVNGLKSVGSTLVNIGSNLVSVFQALGGNIVNFFKNNVDLSSITDTFSNIGSDIASAISEGVVKSGSLMILMTDEQRQYLASLTTEVERYNYIMTQSANIQGQWAGVMDSTNGRLYQMSVWMNTLKSAVTQLANSLLSILAPIITKVVQLATAAVSAIARLFGVDLSSSINTGLSSAGKSIESGVSNLGKSAKKSGKKASKDIKQATDEIKRQVLSFDDVIQISDNKKTESLADNINDLGDVDAGGIENISDAVGGLTNAFGDMFNLEIPEWLQKILDLLDKGDFFGAGALLIQTLVDWLKAIDWDDLGNKLNNFAKHFVEFLNGIFSNTENWRVIGESLGKSLNAFFSMLETFADTFDFKQFGKSITAAINGMIKTIDWRQIGRTLYKYLAGLFDVIHELVDGNVIYNALTGISQTIREFFENLTVEDAKQWGNDLGNAISQALFGLAGIIDSIDFGDIIKILQSALHRIIEDGGIQNFGFSIVSALTEAIRGVDAEQLGTDIADFFNQISNVVISALTSLDIEQLKEAFISLFTRLSENNTIGRIIQAIADLITNVFNSITSDDMNRVADAAVNIVDGILNGLLSIANSIDVEKIIEFARTLLDRVKEWFDNGGKEKIQEFVDKLTEILDEVDKSGVIDAVFKLIDYILDNIDLSELLQKYIDLKVKLWWDDLKLKIQNAISDLSTVLNTDLGKVINYLISNILKPFLGWFFDFEKAVDVVSELLKGNLKGAIDIIKDSFKGLIDKLKDAVDWLKQLFNFSDNKSKLGQFIDSKLGGHLYYEHATGGITNGTSVHFIGEAGREAILPLDQHTEWMDILANRINSNNNASGNNTPVQIDLSTINKPFYTKAEMLDIGILINDCLQVANANT